MGMASQNAVEGYLPHSIEEPSVLIIDDENINVMVLKGMLQASGFKAYTSTDGIEGRSLAAEHCPDVILLDIMMPGENGFDVCRKLKQDINTTNIPIIFISALSDVDNKVRGLELGAVDYITKPFEKAEVVARIRLHLKLKHAQRALIEEQAARLQQITDAQQSMLVRPDDLPEAKFAVKFAPALEAGGDFYDVFCVGRKSCCYFIADISGHDIGASFVTSSLKVLLRQNSGPLYTPEETLTNMNSVLKTVLPNGRFLTAQGCYINRSSMQMTLINAGHLPAVYIDETGQGRTIDAEGDILGIFEHILFVPQMLRVRRGERVFLYTDGLLERFKENKIAHSQSLPKLIELAEKTFTTPLETAVEHIFSELLTGGGGQEDDILLMGIEV